MIERWASHNDPDASYSASGESAEAAALAEIGRVASAYESLYDLYEYLNKVLKTLVPADRVIVALADPRSGDLYREYMSQAIGSESVMSGSSPLAAGGILEQVYDSNTAFISDDISHLVAQFPGIKNAVDSGIRSGVYVPLTVRGQKIGVLGADNLNKGVYRQSHVDLLQKIGNQVAGSIASGQMQRESEREVAERELLAQIGSAASSSLDLELALERAYEILQQLLPADRISISALNDSTGLLDYVYTSGVPIPPVPGTGLRPSPDGLPALVLSEASGRIVNDLEEVEEQAPGSVRLSRAGLHSLVLTPLVSKGEAIGVIAVNSIEAGAYSAHHLDLLERLAPHITGAVLNARLHAEVDRRAREETAFAEIGRILNSVTDLESGFDQISEQISSLIPFDRFALVDIDLSRNTYEFTRHAGVEVAGWTPDDPRPLGGTVAGLVVQTRDPFVTGRADEPEFRERFPGMSEFVERGFSSSLTVPVLNNGSTRALLHFSSKNQDAYEDSHVRIGVRCADHYAGILQKTDLLGRIEREAREENVLAEIGRLISSSLNLQEMFSAISEPLKTLIPYDRFVVTTWDGSTGLWTTRFTAGYTVEGHEAGQARYDNTAVAKRLREEMRPILAAGAEDDDPEYASTVDSRSGPVFQSAVRIPLIVNNSVIGSFAVRSVRREAYDERHVDLARRIGEQISGSVANSELHERVERRAREEALLARIGRLVNSSAELDEVYGQFSEFAGQLLEADRIVITTREGESKFIERYIGGDHAIPGREPRSPLPLQDSLTEKCLVSGETLSWSYSDSPHFWDDTPLMRPVLESGIRSLIGVPLSSRGESFGVLLFTSFKDRAYSDHDVFLAEAVADQIAGGITGARLLEEVARRAEEESVLAQIGRVINSSVDIDATYKQFVQLANRLVPADRVVIATGDGDEHFIERYYDNAIIPGRSPGQRLPLSGSVTGRVIETGETQSWRSGNGKEADISRLPIVRPVIMSGIESFLSVPLSDRGKAFGAVHFISHTDREFSDHEKLLAEAVANQIAGAITGAGLRDEASRRAIEESVLSDLATVITSSLELGDVFPEFAERISSLIPADRVVINAIDSESDEWIDRYGWQGRLIAGDLLDRGPLQGSVTERIADSREPLLLGDPSRGQMLLEDFPGMLQSHAAGVRSTVATPLVVGNDVVGILFIHSVEPNAYTDADVVMAVRLSTMVASAVSNASLLEESARTARERGTLAEIGRLFSSSMDVDEICRELAEPFKNLVPCDRFAVATYDHARDEWTARYTTGFPVHNLHPAGIYEHPVKGALQMLNERATVVIDDHAAGSGDRRLYNAGLRSSLLIPLIARDRVIGNLVAHSRTPGAFGEHDIYLGEQVGRQIAGALDNAVLHEQARRDAHEREIMADIGRVISSSIEPRQVFEEFSGLVRQLIPAMRVSFASTVEGSDVLVSRVTGHEDTDRGSHDAILAEDSLTAHVMQTKSAFVWSDSGSESEIAQSFPALGPLLDDGLSSLIAVPLFAMDQPIGVLHLSAFDGVNFTDKDVSMALAVSAHIAGALSNAELFARTEKEAAQRTGLAEIGRLIGSTLNLTEIYSGVTEQIRQLLPFDRMGLIKVDTDEAEIISLHTVGPAVPDWEPGGRRPLDGTVVRELIDSKRAVLVNTEPGQELADIYPGHAPMASVITIRSMIAAPLLNHGEVFGALFLSSKTRDHYTNPDLELAERVALQMSGAVINADLYERTEKEARERKKLADIARLIGSSLDITAIQHGVAEEIRELIPYDRMSLMRVEGRNVVSLHSLGHPIPEWAPGAVTPVDGSIFADLIESGMGMCLHPDSNEELQLKYPAYRPLIRAMDVRSILAVPLINMGTVIGVLHLTSETPDTYSDVDLQLAERIATQMAGAVVNADLFERTERQARERAVLADIGRVASSSLDLDDLWPRFVESTRELFSYDRLSVTLFDPEAGEWRVAFTAGASLKGSEPGDMRIADHPTARKLLASGKPVIVTGEDGEDEIFRTFVSTPGSEIEFKSMLAVPLIFNERYVGGIALKSGSVGEYSERDADLMERVANLIAGTIANARLHDAANRSAEEEQVLAMIGRLASVSLDFGVAFDNLALALRKIIPYDRFVVMGVDPVARLLWTHFVAGQEVPGWEAGTSHAIADWQEGDLLLPAEGTLIEFDEDVDPNEDVMIAAGLPSCASVPLIWEDRSIGALSVRTRDRKVLTDHHLDLLNRVARQITGAFVNAELHAITERDAEERRLLAEIGRLVNASLDAQELLAAVALPFGELVPNDHFSVATYASDSDTWTTRYVSGEPVEGDLPGDENAANPEFAHWSLEEGNPVSVISRNDVEYRDEQISRLYEHAGLRSAIHIPLVVNGELIGAISARSRERNIYGHKYLELSLRIANQIAGAVANTELHRVLAENEARTRAVVETAAVGIVTADAELNITSVNDSVRAMFGYERDELIGKNVKVLAGSPYREEHDSYLRRYDRTGIPRIIGTFREVMGRRRDGDEFPIELEVTQVELERGKIYTAVIRDITDRKRAEAEIHELTANLEDRVAERTIELEEANAELEAFSYMVSHDLRGPLSMSHHLASNLLKTDGEALSDSSRRYIELIAQSSKESTDLVADLLSFARLGRQQVTIQSVDPTEIARSVEAEIAILTPGVNFILDELPACQADPALLRMVFTNLLSNAFKFSANEPDPEVHVGVTEMNGETVYFVRDNGVGFDMEQAHRVFEVFERLHRTEDYDGTGAGMAIVKRIIDRHDGQIWVESEAGAGTTFFFTLATAALSSESTPLS